MRIVKKLHLLVTLTFLTSFITVMCMQTEVPLAEGIFTEISTDIKRPHVQDFDTFPDSIEGKGLYDQISKLTQDEKNQLLKKVYDILGGDTFYPAKRPYYKLLVLTGADVNYSMSNVFRNNLLHEAVLKKDENFIKFLLQHGAKTTENNYLLRPLIMQVKSYPIAELLIQYDALKPIADDHSLQPNLLQNNFYHPNYDPKLVLLHKKALKEKYGKELNFNVKDSFGFTPLMNLSRNAQVHKRNDFFEKLRILLNEGAVHLQERDTTGLRAIDMINNSLKSSPQNQTLLLAQRLLTDLEQHPAKLKSFNEKNTP